MFTPVANTKIFNPIQPNPPKKSNKRERIDLSSVSRRLFHNDTDTQCPPKPVKIHPEKEFDITYPNNVRRRLFND